MNTIDPAMRFQKHFRILLPVIALFTTCSALSGYAANISPHQTAVNRQQYHRNPNEFVSSNLKQMPDLPGLPNYRGATRFVNGTVFPHATGGASMTIQFSVREQRKQALDWYRQTFQACGWKIDRAMSGRSSLAARNEGHLCQVMAVGASARGFGCDLVVRYRFLSG